MNRLRDLPASSSMSSRERVLRAMRRQMPDRTPFDLSNGLAPGSLDRMEAATGRRDPHEYFQTDVRTVGIAPTRQAIDYSAYHPDLPERAYVDEWGIGHLPTESRESGHRHLDGFLYPMRNLKTPRDVRDYPLPDVDAEYRFARLPGQIRALHARGIAVAASLECTLFETAWYLRGMEPLLMDFLDDSELAAALLNRILEKRLAQARLFAESGVDILRLGDDVATQRGLLMRRETWRRWIRPRLARVIAEARRVNPAVLIFYHSDGNVTDLVPDLIEIGVEILNPVQPECMNLASLKRDFGDRLSFWGGIGTQTTLPFGSPEDVRNAVRAAIQAAGRNGGLLLSPTHMVEPDVPWENLVAFVDAVCERPMDSAGTAPRSL